MVSVMLPGHVTSNKLFRSLGMLKSKFDDGMFYWVSNGKLERVWCFHFGDFVWRGSINFEEQIINVLKETFSVTSQETEMFKYLGLYIDKKMMSLHSIRYCV